MQTVARHFNSEASLFDARILKIVPHYREMLEALAAALPRPSRKKLRILDLGCGTGAVSFLVKNRFPNASLHCVDLVPNMLKLAAGKLRGFSGVTFEQADLRAYVPRGRYDAVVSSLALHHLATDAAKARMHRKIHRALVPGGVFANADITVSARGRLQAYYLAKWAEFIRRSYSEADIRRNYRRYQREDRPSVLLKELRELERIGFRRLEILWKYCNFVTYAAYK